jgi:hypothetical protein
MTEYAHNSAMTYNLLGTCARVICQKHAHASCALIARDFGSQVDVNGKATCPSFNSISLYPSSCILPLNVTFRFNCLAPIQLHPIDLDLCSSPSLTAKSPLQQRFDNCLHFSLPSAIQYQAPVEASRCSLAGRQHVFHLGVSNRQSRTRHASIHVITCHRMVNIRRAE